MDYGRYHTILSVFAALLVFSCTTPPKSRHVATVKKESSCRMESHKLEREDVVEKVILGLDRGQPNLFRPYIACTVYLGPPRAEAEGEYDREKAITAISRELSHYQWQPPFYTDDNQFFLISQKPYVELVFSNLPKQGWFLTAVAAKDDSLRRKLFRSKLTRAR